MAIITLVMTVGCSNAPPTATLSDPSPQSIAENVITETIINEEVLHEFITTEIYLEEIVVAEKKISELLLEEETISEVLSCKTIYVPQDHIDDFAENSQSAQLFGDGINLKSVMAKVAVGTGIILTIAVLKIANLPEPVASIVAAAADESLAFGASGAAIGSLFGGLTGALNEIDETGRLSALVGFATATAGLILSIVSLVAIPASGGSTTITLAKGIKLVIAGVLVLSAATGTVQSGYNAVKTFQSTDEVDIDWNNIDWEKAGVSAAEKAVNNAADGYMWGAIIGAVHSGAEGYDYYQKYNTPYSSKDARYNQTPKDGNGGKWTGKRGDSDFILDEPIEFTDGNTTIKIEKVTYKNGVPDFSPYQKAQVKISNMTNNRPKNFRQADEVLAEYWTRIKYKNKTWTVNDKVNEIEAFRKQNGYTWHEMNNMESMQLVPTEVNAKFGHLGGVGEYNAMIGQEGDNSFE